MQISDDNLDSTSGGGAAFWITYLVTVVLVVLRGLSPDAPYITFYNDDMMRLLEVRDLLSGQGWFDTMQYRLGETGVLMHWSRLIDLPLAAMIGALSLVLTQEWAETITLYLWPLLLIGPTLWVVRVAAIRFGDVSGVFGLIFGAIAIVVSEKFNPGSLDHHNVQLLLIGFALMVQMSRADTYTKGALGGAAVALSLTIGFETLPVVAAISGAIAIIWCWKGDGVRQNTLGYSAGFAVVLGVVFVATQPNFSATAFQCDAFGLDLMVVGLFGSISLFGFGVFFSSRPLLWRFAGTVLLAFAVVIFAKLYAPACLQNPLSQLSPDVATEWLGRITEAKSLLNSVKSDGAGNFGLLIVPVIAVIYAVILGRNADMRPQALILILAILATYALTFYQLRGLFFMLQLSAIPIAAMTGRLYGRYKKSGNAIAGIAVIGAMLVSVPDLWSLAYINWPASSSTVEVSHLPQGAFDDCSQQNQLEPLGNLPLGFVASSTDMGAALLLYTPHRVLSANFHRNQDGIQTGIDLARADLDQANTILVETGIDYVILCANDYLPLALSKGNPDGLWPNLYANKVPDFLRPVVVNSNNPDLIRVYEVVK